MAHDVFISYSHHDKPAADAVCANLESRGVRCWIAPRDAVYGMNWSASIVDAIEGAQVMVLIFSQNANASQQIHREVERAASKELPIFPIRIQATEPGRNLILFLGTQHWLDAITPPFELHLDQICKNIKVLLDASSADRSAPPRSAPVASASAERAISFNTDMIRPGDSTTEAREKVQTEAQAKEQVASADRDQASQSTFEPAKEKRWRWNRWALGITGAFAIASISFAGIVYYYNDVYLPQQHEAEQREAAEKQATKAQREAQAKSEAAAEEAAKAKADERTEREAVKKARAEADRAEAAAKASAKAAARANAEASAKARAVEEQRESEMRAEAQKEPNATPAAHMSTPLTEEARMYEVEANDAIANHREDDAIGLYRKAIEVAPWVPGAHYNLAILLADEKHFGEAVSEMQKYLALVPNASDARRVQDQIYVWQGREQAGR